jgi:hypothetical protein
VIDSNTKPAQAGESKMFSLVSACSSGGGTVARGLAMTGAVLEKSAVAGRLDKRPGDDEMNMESDNATGKAGEQEKKRTRKWIWLWGLAVAILVFIYLWFVFLALFQRDQTKTPGYFAAKEGRSIPVLDEGLRAECKPIYDKTILTPYKDHDFREFSNRGHIWLLDAARTEMYGAELLKYPRCLQFRLQEMAAAKNRVILVLYDKATQSDVLVIRNYP